MRGWRSAMSYFGRLLGSLALVLVLPGVAPAQESEAAWDAIRPQIFGERAIEDGSSVVELVAPKRAEDAALVPIDLKVRVREGAAPVKAVTLVIDENPPPLAATFTFGEDRRSFDLSTRMRVNSYSFVRAIAETSDGASSTWSKPTSRRPAVARRPQARTWRRRKPISVRCAFACSQGAGRRRSRSVIRLIRGSRWTR